MISSRIHAARLASIVLTAVLLAASCGSDGASTATSAQPTVDPTAEQSDHAGPSDTATTDSAPDADDPAQTEAPTEKPEREEFAGIVFDWASPDSFDSTFGDGSTVLDLAGLVPDPTEMPPTWLQVDFGNEEPAECLGDEPDALVQVGWVAPPEDPLSTFPELIVLTLEHHGDDSRARAAADRLGTEEWALCQSSQLDGSVTDGVDMMSSNPAGEVIDAPFDRQAVGSRRQIVMATAFDVSFELVGDTHVWTEGPVLYALAAVSASGSSEELARSAESALSAWTPPPLQSPETQQVLDENLPIIRASIERDEAELRFYTRQTRATFGAGTPAQFRDCATDVGDGLIALMNGPNWATATGASLVNQGGLVFATDDQARAELERYAALADACVVERAAPVLGDHAVEEVTSEFLTIGDTEVFVVTASMTQLATNPGIPNDVAVIAQRTIAQSGNRLVGFGFIGVAGDEPDLVTLTVEAADRMAGK